MRYLVFLSLFVTAFAYANEKSNYSVLLKTNFLGRCEYYQEPKNDRIFRIYSKSRLVAFDEAISKCEAHHSKCGVTQQGLKTYNCPDLDGRDQVCCGTFATASPVVK